MPIRIRKRLILRKNLTSCQVWPCGGLQVAPLRMVDNYIVFDLMFVFPTISNSQEMGSNVGIFMIYVFISL